jgi:hypothetical protein
MHTDLFIFATKKCHISTTNFVLGRIMNSLKCEILGRAPRTQQLSESMDSFNRHLRDGSVTPESGCALAVFIDSLDIVGSRNVFEQCSRQFIDSVIDGRSQASHVYYFALEKSPVILPEHNKVVTVLNLHASLSQEWASGYVSSISYLLEWSCICKRHAMSSNLENSFRCSAMITR